MTIEMPGGAAKVLLFDMDGTLVDSIGVILASYRHAMHTVFGEGPPDEMFRRGIGTPLRVQLAALIPEPARLDEVVAVYSDHYRALTAQRVELYPGVAEVLATLRAKGVPLALVTSKTSVGTKRSLEVSGLEGMFEVVISADSVQRPKPDPQPVLLALERLDARAEDAIFIGDSPHDLESGRRAQVRTAAVLWGPFPREELEPYTPDLYLHDPKEILDLVR